MSEVKAVMPQANPHWEGYGHAAGGHDHAAEHAHDHHAAPAIGGAAVATTGGHS